MAKTRPLNVWLLLGAQDAGKSSIIRHLTGVFRDSFAELQQIGSRPSLRIRAIISSVNERTPIVPVQDWINDLLTTATGASCPNVILPLRYSSKTASHPTAAQYFRALSNVSQIQFVVAASAPPAGLAWVPPIALTIPKNSGTTFTNTRARAAARLFQWR